MDKYTLLCLMLKEPQGIERLELQFFTPLSSHGGGHIRKFFSGKDLTVF